MKIAMGTVIGGQVVLDKESFQEGTRVMVVAVEHLAHESLSPEEHAELLAAIAEADRGETITGEELFERLMRSES